MHQSVFATPIIGVCHCLGTYSEHALDKRAATAIGVSSGQLALDTSVKSAFGEGSRPITRFGSADLYFSGLDRASEARR